jgi:serine/threonine-protein kinase RsbW
MDRSAKRGGAGGSAATDDPTPPASPGFQVTLSLLLPRDRLSVPITRHLIRAAMDEVGVVAGDAEAVELAVTEACANVIDHSGPGDAYEVATSIGPSACHMRVVDVGRGFDHSALSFFRMADQDAEHGRGMALMHALVDQVRFESEPERGTVVHLVKHLTFEDDAAAHRLTSNPTPPKA